MSQHCKRWWQVNWNKQLAIQYLCQGPAVNAAVPIGKWHIGQGTQDGRKDGHMAWYTALWERSGSYDKSLPTVERKMILQEDCHLYPITCPYGGLHRSKLLQEHKPKQKNQLWESSSYVGFNQLIPSSCLKKLLPLLNIIFAESWNILNQVSTKD